MRVAAVICLLVAVALASFPKDWNRLRAAHDHETISFSIALKQRNVDKLEARLVQLLHLRSKVQPLMEDLDPLSPLF